MALKKGVCKNFDNCDLADKQEIQEVESTEFKCSECGKDLHEIATTTKPKGGSKKIVVIAAILVVIIGAACAYLLVGNEPQMQIEPKSEPQTEQQNEEPQNKPQTEQQVTEVNSTDEFEDIGCITEEEMKELEAEFKNNQQAETQYDYDFGWAKYNGPMKGGKPHGPTGTLKITRRYSIDLKDGLGSTLDVYPGETIENTKFENGRLRSGELHRLDGTRPYFNI